MPATARKYDFVSNAYPRRRRKVTPVQIDEIRRRKSEGEKPTDLALEFGITAGYIREL